MIERKKAQNQLGFVLSTIVSLGLVACSPAAGTSEPEPTQKRPDRDASADASPSDGQDGSFVAEPDAGAPVCTPKTCEDLGAECGFIADGCNGVVDCGGCSEPGESCGGSGIANRCGGACQPRNCDDLGANCGEHGDGCGGKVDCGSCEDGELCGAGGPSLCGPKDGGCSPQSKDEACSALGAECGEVADGCGGTVDCGGCAVGESCGGGGEAFRCGKADDCEPKSCAEQGYDCGYATDGCGNVIDCGPIECEPGEVCGGGGDNRCGHDPSDPCPGGTTSVSGTVYMPNGTVPLYGALVYIPKTLDDIPAFTDKVACERCDDEVPPTAVAYTTSAIDGSFTLKGVPAGAKVPLVIQVGRFRRKVDISVNACQSHHLPANLTRLAKRHKEGSDYDHIPKMAMVTGMADALECVLRRVGIEDSQFSKPAGSGRIHIVQADTYGGGRGPRLAPGDFSQPRGAEIYGNASTLEKYDMVLLACQSMEINQNSGHVQRLIDYTNKGGRVFATHYSYTWLNKTSPFSGTANWTGEKPSWTSRVATVDTSFTKGLAFAEWLKVVGATVGSDPSVTQINITEPRASVSAVSSNAQQWISLMEGSKHYVQHMTFNAPVGLPVEEQCGRVVFSDFHVTGGDSLSSKNFPEQCEGRANLNAQEKALAFMLFDVASCIQGDGTSKPCEPKSCAAQGLACGKTGDGCGNILECGDCDPGLTCGGGGVPGQCGKKECKKLSCDDLGLECGPAGDGCGGTLDCGDCPAGESCGGGGPGICGAATCSARTCADQGIACGPAGDGCGELLECGDCPGDQRCGGGGVPGQCGGGVCEPTTCAKLGFECGVVADGCGKLLDCGSCVAPMSCGGDGRPGKCGGIR